ncbi:MAG: NAD(P)H-hydrate dehydratase [Flavobacteriales bacterium]|nr:NAD(P)H-hydrate dehydratase [Flavobacteriales bacterium]
MKILSPQQIREADAYTISHEPIASIDLMERAANVCAEWVTGHFPKKTRFAIFCGMGNNGGDGLALGRILADEHMDIDIFVLCHSENGSEEFVVNKGRVEAMKQIGLAEIRSIDDFPALEPGTVIVDALFGSGINRDISGVSGEVINKINSLDAMVISIDLPSGLYCDDNDERKDAHIIRASHTLTFQQPKLAFMFSSSVHFTGDWHVLDIGLDRTFLADVAVKDHFIEAGEVRGFYRQRARFGHKGTYGHSLLLAGSYGKIGAAVLASRAALRSGTGLLTSAIPRCGYDILQSVVPEAMVITDEDEHFLTQCPPLAHYRAIAMGPGIGTETQTANVLKVLIQECKVPLVLDADALNILAEHPTWLSFLPPGTILTPHPGEFERLAGVSSGDHDRYQRLKSFAAKYQIFVILKGGITATAGPDGRCFFNSTGNPGMATAGSGDVLTGVLLGLLAQGYSEFEACLLGVYIHGLAGDLALQRQSQESLLSGDLCDWFGQAFQTLA